MGGVNANTGAVEAVKRALQLFAPDALSSLTGALAEHDDVHRALAIHEQRLGLAWEEASRRLRAAQAELNTCLASGAYDEDGNYHPPNCKGFQDVVDRWVGVLKTVQDEAERLRTMASELVAAQREFAAEGAQFRQELSAEVAELVRLSDRLLANFAQMESVRLGQTQSAWTSHAPAVTTESGNASRAETDQGRGGIESRG